MPSNAQVYGTGQSTDENAQRDNVASSQEEEHIRSVEVQKYLQGVRFPANKHDLVEYAVERQAPSRIVDLLQQLPASDFGSPNAIKLYKGFEDLIGDIESPR